MLFDVWNIFWLSSVFFRKAQELDITGILQLGFCRKQNPLGQAVWESHPHIKADKPKEALMLWEHREFSSAVGAEQKRQRTMALLWHRV